MKNHLKESSLFIQVHIFFFTLFLTGCSTSSLPAAKIQIVQGGGKVPIHWLDLPRPSPLPNLDHAAMLVPVSIAGINTKPLYMQFDLGAPSTLIYSNKWKSIIEKSSQSSMPDHIPKLEFKLGDMSIIAHDVSIMQRKGTGINWEEKGLEIVGTIGADLIDSRIVVIDLKNDSILLAKERQGLSQESTVFKPFKFMGRRILLTGKFEGDEKNIMYDSGSSAFSWLTSESVFKRLAKPNAQIMTYPVGSWGNTLTAHTVATDAVVEFANVSLPIKEISYISDMGLLQQAAISGMGVGGMVGNKLFLGKRLIIDTKKLEYAIEN